VLVVNRALGYGRRTALVTALGSVVANPKTAAGPRNVTALPGASSISLSWDPPTGDYSDTVNAYRVYWLDTSVPGSFLDSVKTTGTALTLSNLTAGHRYLIAISSINAAGESLPAGGPATIVDAGTPAAPTLQSAVLLDGATVKLTWTAVSGAAGYWIWLRNVGSGEPLHQLPLEVDGPTNTVGWLFDGAANYEFCVQAANGSLRSPLSNCLAPPSGVPRPWPRPGRQAPARRLPGRRLLRQRRDPAARNEPERCSVRA
jgi:hypothetical protein